MGFQRAVVIQKDATKGTGIKVSLRSNRSGNVEFAISVSGEAITKLGWHDKMKLEALIGDNSDHGIIRLKQDADGQVTAQERSAKAVYLHISLGHQPQFVNRPHDAKWCAWEVVDGDWVEIVLPEWADITHPTKKKMEPAPAAPQPPQAQPQPKYSSPAAKAARPGKNPETTPFLRKQNVTAAVMGDPPPGRREMLDRIGKLKA